MLCHQTGRKVLQTRFGSINKGRTTNFFDLNLFMWYGQFKESSGGYFRLYLGNFSLGIKCCS